MEKLLDVSKADPVAALTNHLKTMSSLGNEDLLAQLHPGKSATTMDSILVMRLSLVLLLHGLEIDLVGMVVVRILTMQPPATMLPLLPTQLHGLSRLRLTQLPLHTQDTRLLATPVVIKPKELRQALLLLQV